MSDDQMLKPVIWVGSSRRDLRAFPEAVQDAAATTMVRVAISGALHKSIIPDSNYHYCQPCAKASFA